MPFRDGPPDAPVGMPWPVLTVAVAYNSRVTPDPTDETVQCADCQRDLVQSATERAHLREYQEEQQCTLPLICGTCATERLRHLRESQRRLGFFGPNNLVQQILTRMNVAQP